MRFLNKHGLNTSVCIALLIAAVSCGKTPVSTISHRGGTSPLALALEYERGMNGPRDYAKAAGVYESACADGNGDLAACRKLVDAIVAARGVTRDLERVLRVATTMCRRHDLRGCATEFFVSYPLGNDSSAAEAELAQAQPEERCRKGDATSCELMLAFQFPNFQGSPGVERMQDATAHLACVAGVLDGCLALIEEMRYCSYGPDAQHCADDLVAKWRNTNPTTLAALAYVRGQCDLGDALACNVLPGRETSYSDLCKAHDYTACGNAGCLGDCDAAALAERHSAKPNCSAVAARDEAKHLSLPKPRVALPAEPKRATPAPHDALPFRTLAFRQLEIEPDNWHLPSFEMTNLSTRTVIYVDVVVYAYDKSGKQVARSDHEHIGPIGLEPGESSSGPLAAVPISDETVSFDVCYDFISFEGETSDAIGGTSDAARCPDQWIKGSGGAPLDASGTLAQRRYHAVASPGAVHYATTEGLKDGASARGLADLAAHMTDFAGSNVRSSTADYLDIPVLVGAVGVIYHLEGVTSLRLDPTTLAKIFQRDIKKWNDRAIAKDNPRAKLPDKPIIVFREIGFEGYTDRDVDTTRAFVSYLRRNAADAWHSGPPETFAWPTDMKRASGLSSIVSSHDGAIAFIELSAAEPGSTFAAIRNRAGKYIAPNGASMRAAARELDVKTGTIEPKKADAYPIVFPSYVVVSAKQTDKARGTLVVAYLRTLLGEGQRKLESVGFAPLPESIAAKSRELVDSIALP